MLRASVQFLESPLLREGDYFNKQEIYTQVGVKEMYRGYAVQLCIHTVFMAIFTCTRWMGNEYMLTLIRYMEKYALKE